MMRLLITAFALVAIFSAPAFFRSSPATVASQGVADCKRIMPSGVQVSLQ
jgi:hypothetical protein